VPGFADLPQEEREFYLGAQHLLEARRACLQEELSMLFVRMNRTARAARLQGLKDRFDFCCAQDWSGAATPPDVGRGQCPAAPGAPGDLTP
jgi:hypothetical protein